MPSNKKTERDFIDDFESSLIEQIEDVEERPLQTEEVVTTQSTGIIFKPIPTAELDKKVSSQLKNFTDLLDSLSSLEEKKKALWKQIYENAVTDRKNAYTLFADLYKDVHNNPNEHAIHGPTLSKYLERMEKSNQQLIKLAEMIDDVVEIEEEYLADEDSIYDKILQEQGQE